MSEIKYIYLGNQKGTTHDGVISIGYTLDGNIVNYAVAFCSKNDRFVKKISHKIISGRIATDISGICIAENDTKNYSSIKLYMISLLKQYPYTFANVPVPSWAQNIISKL